MHLPETKIIYSIKIIVLLHIAKRKQGEWVLLTNFRIAEKWPKKWQAGSIKTRKLPRMAPIITEGASQHLFHFLIKINELSMERQEELRVFLQAGAYILYSGAQWCLLPENYGDWNKIKRWSDRGIGHYLLSQFKKTQTKNRYQQIQ